MTLDGSPLPLISIKEYIFHSLSLLLPPAIALRKTKDTISVYAPEGHEFNSQSGHIPRCEFNPQSGGEWEAMDQGTSLTSHQCFSLSIPHTLKSI